MKKQGAVKQKSNARRRATKRAAGDMPSDRELLAELSTLDSCEARVPTVKDHDRGLVPPWCEVVMTLERDERELDIHLRRHDGELIIEVLHEVLHPTTGRSIVSMMWRELDDVMDRIMAKGGKASDKAEARGLAKCIALITNPYAPNMEAIRAVAMERYEARRRSA